MYIQTYTSEVDKATPKKEGKYVNIFSKSKTFKNYFRGKRFFSLSHISKKFNKLLTICTMTITTVLLPRK